MRVFVLDSEGGSGLDFCLRAIADGHEVKYWHNNRNPVGKGFPGLTRVQDWRDGVKWAGKDGLIVPTGNSRYTMELDRFRDLGYPVFGPSTASAALEIERSKGMEAMKAIGIDLPHYETFNCLTDALAFARKSPDPHVFKPMGSEEDKALTYVSDSPADMCGWLERQIARGMKLKAPCMLQEKIDMIAEVGVSGWFGPEGFLPERFQECWEFKKWLAGDKGPSTGEEGTVTAYTKQSKLADDFLLPMAPVLQTLGHRGDFAIGCGVDSKGKVWPFEFTCRLGWPAFYIQTASHKGDVAQWMRDLLDGKDTLKVDYRPAIGVVLSQPPYPQFNGKEDNVVGNPICGIDEVRDQVHPVMMMMGKGPCMDGDKVVDAPCCQTAGELVMVVTGLGSTVEKAQTACYKAVDAISYSDKQHRVDIGSRLERQLPMVQKHGYCLDTDWD